MVSKIEARWNAILEAYKPQIPKVNDLLVQTYRKVQTEVDGETTDEFWDYPYYFHQLDCVTLPKTVKFPSKTPISVGGEPVVVDTTMVLPHLPINWELDDETHDQLKRVRKDKSRDIHLWDTNHWVIKAKEGTPYTLVGLSGSSGWVLARIKYADLEFVVKADHTLNLENRTFTKSIRKNEALLKSDLKEKKRKAVEAKLIESRAKQEEYRQEHQAKLDLIFEVVSEALNATTPMRIALVEGKIKRSKLREDFTEDDSD